MANAAILQIPEPGQSYTITLAAPFAAPAYTLRFDAPTGTPRQITEGGQAVALKEARALRDLKPGTWIRVKDKVTVCFDLSKGKSILLQG